MFRRSYFTQLSAAIASAVLMGFGVHSAGAIKAMSERAAAPREMFGKTACANTEALLSAGFAPETDVLGFAPLGSLTPHDAPAPTPTMRLTARGEEIAALSPAKADLTAIKRVVTPSRAGAPERVSWSVRIKPCRNLVLAYDGLDSLDPVIERALVQKRRMPSQARPAALAMIRLSPGQPIGRGSAFDVRAFENSSPDRAISVETADALFDSDPGRARCALELLPRDLRQIWIGLLADARGRKLAPSGDACRVRPPSGGKGAEGEWLTDSSHGGATNKVSAIALGVDIAAPNRLVFALAGRLATFASQTLPSADRDIARASLWAPPGGGRINQPFADVKPGEIYCYQDLTSEIRGAPIDGVMLLQWRPSGLTLELQRDAARCIDLAEPWSFSGAQTSFYR